MMVEQWPLEVVELMRPRFFLDNCNNKKNTAILSAVLPMVVWPTHAERHLLSTFVYLEAFSRYMSPELSNKNRQDSATCQDFSEKLQFTINPKRTFGKKCSQLYFIILSLLASESLQPSRHNPCKTSSVSAEESLSLLSFWPVFNSFLAPAGKFHISRGTS